jgi:hypothetical protein
MSPTMRPIRLLLLVVLAALLGVWAWSTRMPAGARIGGPASSTPAAGSGPAAVDLRVTTERLDAWRRAPGPPPRPVGRNPFQFGGAPRLSAPRPAQPVDAGPLAVAAVTAPTLSLLGIVDRTIDGKPVRVAVVSMGETLYYVSVGDRVGTQYETLAVTADAVELRDLTDGSTRRVALK